ncbi:MAG: hypothetical protein JSV12_05455 [Candidatus Bathyarchaeota archaeon]|nr:MAG: hypothetical protein JSV12_05455 [Candidatus Bathyarchaeota archaeon]
MEKKKRIGLLTLVVFIAGTIMAIIDAVVTVSYGVMETVAEQSSAGLQELVFNGPIWWKINPIIIITIISVGVIAFLLGSDGGTSTRPSKQLFELAPVFLTFVTISFSGLGDVISQSFIEFMTGNNPLNWLHKDWWWTRFMPIPAVIAFLAGHSVPTGTDMLIGSIVGISILVAMWLYYYKQLDFPTRIVAMWKKRNGPVLDVKKVKEK